MIPVFVLSYNGLNYFEHWFKSYFPTMPLGFEFFIIDNGRQLNYTTDDNLWHRGIHYYSTLENIGCAGGWNLMCDIGLDYYYFDKIIIGQDDALFDEAMLKDVFNSTNDTTLAGAYANGFTFSLFGITQKIRNTLGRFDENLVYVTFEDCDYTQRAYRANIEVKCLGYDQRYNKNLVSSTPAISLVREKNKAYMDVKWGEKWDKPHPMDMGMHENFREAYGDRTVYPSASEFTRFRRVRT